MRLFRIILCFVLSVALFSFAGCAKDKKQNQIDMDLHGTIVRNGQITQTSVSFSITGMIPAEVVPGGPIQYTHLSIRFPETFTYACSDNQDINCRAYYIDGSTESTYFLLHADASNRTTHMPVAMKIYLCLEKEYVVVCWSDDKDCYLVASPDKNTDPTAILSYFQGFIDLYAFENRIHFSGERHRILRAIRPKPLYP